MVEKGGAMGANFGYLRRSKMMCNLPLLLNAFDIRVPCIKYVRLHIRFVFGSEVAAEK